MKVIFIVLFFLTLPAFAQTEPEIKLAVAHDINTILGDTVNEGEMHAEVKVVKKVPVMECEVLPSKKDPAMQLARCDVTFKVKLDTDVSCEANCFLIYKVKKHVYTAVKKLEAACLENLATTDCQ